MENRENPIFGRKVFFLNPTLSIQNVFVRKLQDLEYEVYTIEHYYDAKPVLSEYEDSICFINIDDQLTYKQWFNFIKSFEKDSSLETVFLGVISEKIRPHEKEEFLLKTKLAGVTGLKAQGVTATAIQLDWDRNTSATGYIIEQYKGGKWTQIAVTKNNYTLTFTVKGLAECTPYSFRVKAYKNDGGKTNYSDYVTVKASTLLGTVKNAKVTLTTGTWITLGWDRNTGATGYVLEQYKGGKWTEIAVTKNNTTLSFTVKGLRNDTTYSFRIKAYKTVGDTTTYGSYVRIVGTTDIPNVAGFTGSAVSQSAVKLSWSRNDKAEGYIIEQYKGGRWTEIKAVDSDVTEITVEKLAKGTPYTFRIKSVRTVDGADKSSDYASVRVTTGM